MVTHFRAVAGRRTVRPVIEPLHLEALAIAALLPRPVDPDLIEAREVVCGYHHDKHPESPWHIGQAELVRSGRNDNMLDVQAAYFGLKRGRELAALEASK